MCLATAYLHKHTHTPRHKHWCAQGQTFTHACSLEAACTQNLQTSKKKKNPLHTCTNLCTAIVHSRVQQQQKRKSQRRMWVQCQTRLICILPSLEVNMHESIKRYALKQTTRSIRITVPTSEPFILLLACNQADLVHACWWFHTTNWTYKMITCWKEKTNTATKARKRVIYACSFSKICTKTILGGVFGHTFLSYQVSCNKI